MSPFHRLLHIMIKPWVIALYLAFVIALFFCVDKPVAEYLNTLDLQNNFALLKILTQLGSFAAWLVLFLAGALYCRYVRRNRVWEERCWFMWSCMLLTSVICALLKTMLGRARPEAWFADHAWGFYGFQMKSGYWSFPSGHTSTIMTLAFGLSILFPKHVRSFILIGLLVAVSRVLLVQHYLSDVMIAAYLSLLEVGFLCWLARKKAWFPRVLHTW